MRSKENTLYKHINKINVSGSKKIIIHITNNNNKIIIETKISFITKAMQLYSHRTVQFHLVSLRD